MSTMPFEQLEHVYEQLAQAIDRAGEQNEALFLAKLVLTLAHQAADPARFEAAVEIALQDLVVEPADGVP